MKIRRVCFDDGLEGEERSGPTKSRGHRYRRRYARRRTRCSACIDKPPRTDRFRSEVTITRAPPSRFLRLSPTGVLSLQKRKREAKSRVPFPPFALNPSFFSRDFEKFWTRTFYIGLWRKLWRSFVTFVMRIYKIAKFMELILKERRKWRARVSFSRDH